MNVNFAIFEYLENNILIPESYEISFQNKEWRIITICLNLIFNIFNCNYKMKM